ncbi:MAG: PstA family ABC transporter permease [Lachnospirales bacterium]
MFIYIFLKGIAVVDFNFIFDKPRGLPLGTEGGIFPAIMGTIFLGALSSLFASGIALFLSIYLFFYLKKGFYKNFIHSILFFMSGFPSVIFGLVFYTIFIYKLNIQRSLFTASLTVAIMIIPFITLRLLQIFKYENEEIILTALSLGYTKSFTIFKIVLPNTKKQIISAIILGMSYGIGATAPVMFTGAVLFADVPNSIFEPFMTLPYHLYFLIADGISIENAYGTAFVLMILMLIINLLPRIINFEKIRDMYEQ